MLAPVAIWGYCVWTDAAAMRQSMQPLPLVICLEGSIGVGKSTQIERLKTLFAHKNGVTFVDEPVEEWVEHGFLQGMYNGTINTATFQHMVLISLAGDLLKAVAGNPAIVICERSVNGNFHVFGRANLSGMDLSMFEFTWKRVMSGMPSEMDMRYIYLEAPVSFMMERTRQRARAGEVDMKPEYMSIICNLHEEWMKSEPKCKRIDATRSVDLVFKDVCGQISSWAMEHSQKYVRLRNEYIKTETMIVAHRAELIAIKSKLVAELAAAGSEGHGCRYADRGEESPNSNNECQAEKGGV